MANKPDHQNLLKLYNNQVSRNALNLAMKKITDRINLPKEQDLFHRVADDLCVIRFVKFSPDGAMIAAASGSHAILFDTEKKCRIKTFSGHKGIITSLCFINNGVYLLTIGQDGTVRMWHTANGQCLKVFRPTNSVACLCPGPGDNCFISAGLKEISIWDIKHETRRKLISELSSGVSCLQVMSDGKHLLAGSHDGRMRLYKTETGTIIKEFTSHRGGILSLALCNDKHMAVSSGWDHYAHLWDVDTGGCLWSLRHPDKVTSVVIDPSGRWILTGCHDNKARLWDIPCKRLSVTYSGHFDWIHSAVVNSSGKTVATGSEDMTIKLWDRHSGDSLDTLGGHSGGLISISLSGNGKRLFTGGYDGTVKAIDLRSGRRVMAFQGHTGWVSDLTISNLDATSGHGQP